MILETDFHSDERNREILPENAAEIPFRCLHTQLDCYHQGQFPWHWHDVIEINYVETGTVEYQSPEGSMTLRKGDAVFINSGVMHAFHAVDPGPCSVIALLFDISFLSGLPESALDKEYIYPVVRCRELSLYLIRPDQEAGVQLMVLLHRMMRLFREEGYAYELKLRSCLLDFWCCFLEQTKELRAAPAPGTRIDAERIKLMVKFIQANYGRHITLNDIAAAASISTREANRCFLRCINNSPVNYLNEYRLMAACRLLCTGTDSILFVSEQCGFSSCSYFGRLFHDTYGMTPGEYRRFENKTAQERQNK